MKKYKPNYMVTIMFQLCNMFIAMFPGIAIMWIILNPKDIKGVLYIFPTYLVIVLFFIIFGNIIHLIISLFKKHRVFIDNEFLTVKGKKELTQKIKLCDVKNITLDHGVISKVGGGTAFSINLFNDDYSKSVNISNPSFFMVIEIIKKCKNAKVKFNNWKWYIISSISFALFCILLCVFGLSGN